MIDLHELRRLTFSSSHADVPDHLSAASGIVVAGEFLYVIADDDLHLGVFDAAGQRDGFKVHLFPGDLPDDPAARKAQKPDLEALVRLPPFAGYPSGALLAFASGSRSNRQTGALLRLDDSGALRGSPRAVDLSALYAPLQRRFPGLNIEGAAVCDQRIVLLQRASRGHPENALIRLPLADVLQALGAADELQLPELPVELSTIELGQIGDVPLGFTDAAALPDGRLVFSAVCESVDGTYHDGPCVGAAVGILGTDGQVQRLDFVRPVRKIEGIDARLDGGFVRLLLVSDADDRSRPGGLFSAALPWASEKKPP
ncbi:MAG TPA: hypothetical protein VLF18_10545 [Tahibacter sp.]|uniref:DUF6929 family protein n=1 Tax=Tahibacter sp. TaxID=2056211 RepID=UPI002B746BFB|nr:hypothetical protein [Tahibacter sp.]HSX60627.1 hypothetical protein [Tahibacter sp.]